MGDKTGISWTEATWNPLVGCEHISPGCDMCYAARLAAGRLDHLPAYHGLAVRNEGEHAKFTGEIRLLRERLDQPLRWKRPRRIFVNSMSDLFHRDVPEDFIREVFDVMARAHWHTFQILTKRPQRMRTLSREQIATPDQVDDGYEFGIIPSLWDTANQGIVAPNIHLGSSIENSKYMFRADHVRATDAAVRFLSLEPLIGPLPALNLAGIDWVIVGGESGPGARPMAEHWAADLRDRCADAGIPFMFKQAGTVLARQWGATGTGHKPEEWPAPWPQEYPT